MVTLLPAVAWLVLRVRPGAFLEPRRVLAVAAIVAACAAQYGLLLLRGADGAAPYRASPINGPGELLPFVTGAGFHHQMFGFGFAELLGARLPRFLETALDELAPMAFFIPLGVAALRRIPANAFLVLAYLGNLVFALGYDIPDLPPYFIPNHLLGALFLGAGLDLVRRGLDAGSKDAARALIALALASPLVLGSLRLPRVMAGAKRDAAAHARTLLESLGPGTILIAEYHDYHYLLYYRLAEGRGRAGPYIADESIELGQVLSYLRDGQPLWLRQLGISVPPGLELYSQKLFAPKRYAQAGLTVEQAAHDLYRISYSRAQAP
jgi:hypothetical protein